MDPLNQAASLEHVESLPHGSAIHSEALGQRPLCGQPIPGTRIAPLDPFGQRIDDLQVDGNPRQAHSRTFRACRSSSIERK